jgi:hypothetical protein
MTFFLLVYTSTFLLDNYYSINFFLSIHSFQFFIYLSMLIIITIYSNSNNVIAITLWNIVYIINYNNILFHSVFVKSLGSQLV